MFSQKSYGKATRLKIFYTSKKISLPFHRQAKQELKIKVAQNWLEGSFYPCSSHHKFFWSTSKLLWVYMAISEWSLRSWDTKILNYEAFKYCRMQAYNSKLRTIEDLLTCFDMSEQLYFWLVQKSCGHSFFKCRPSFWLRVKKKVDHKVASMSLKFGKRVGIG